MGCVMSKDNMDNFNLFSHIDDEIYRPNVELSESKKNIMDSYKATLNVISYHDVIPDSLKAAVDSLKDLSKAIDFGRNSALTSLQALAKSVSDTASALQSVHLQNSLDVLKGIDFSGLSSMGDMSQLFGSIPDDITVDTVSELIKNGEITDEDFRSELKSTITGTENKAVKDKPSLIKKALKFVSIQLIVFLMAALISPVTDKVKEEIIETLRVNEFWQSTGIIDWIDSWSNDNHTATEDEAKATVDESKTGNISKQKREDLLSKVKEIRNFISNAPQDENTGNLLSYLSEIEKDINGKKYGLVFEEHREDIDEVLETHTPVLTEETDLFIDNGGQMNFLIEGDNLASLKLLEKTHKGQIDLIYIDPPYNTGNNDFIYDDVFIEKKDSFIHSKWLSFISERIRLARKLLTDKGVIIISIGYQEVHNLVSLCQEIFYDRQTVCVTVQTSGGKPNGGFTYTQEYLVFIVPQSFSPNAMSFTGGIIRSPFEGLTLSTFDKTTRPNQTYPIFVDKKTMHIVGTGKSLTERINEGSYNGELKDYVFETDETPEGCATLWPISSKGADCVWRLISSRLMNDWNRGYIKVSKNKSKVNPNEFSVQYLPDGVIKKIESGELDVIGHEENAPTLKFGKNETVGSEIPTIWTEKDFFTTKGSSYVRNLFGDKRFPYPKPLEYIVELLRASTDKDSIILDFFAGSGTTGEATMLLNRATEGNRQFILCTNNENNICREVTYERIRRVIEKDKYTESLKYYKVEYVPISERLYYEYADELLLHIRELVELENGINFIGNAEIAIILTDDELDNFTQNIEQYSACRKLYMGHDLLPDEDQERIIEENNIEINIIPDYYYRDLQES